MVDLVPGGMSAEQRAQVTITTPLMRDVAVSPNDFSMIQKDDYNPRDSPPLCSRDMFSDGGYSYTTEILTPDSNLSKFQAVDFAEKCLPHESMHLVPAPLCDGRFVRNVVSTVTKTHSTVFVSDGRWMISEPIFGRG